MASIFKKVILSQVLVNYEFLRNFFLRIKHPEPGQVGWVWLQGWSGEGVC